MSPVEQRGRGHVGRAATVSAIAVVLVFGGLWLVTLVLSDRNSPDLRIGDQTFTAGRTDAVAESIEKHGPLLLPDVSGRQDRNLILQHIGDDPETGWSAFLANPPDKDQSCTWEWQPDEELFRAKCDPTRTAPADGAGLEQFDVTVGDTIVIDLNADARASYEAGEDGTTTSAP
ncbi:MAG: hypothetical protein KF906_03450 [Actinobacteria bacterium]|nr:hypothetical protein [Actinomycetota bacterium]